MRTPALIILAAALLGGCFYAEDALVTRRTADFPVIEGAYTHTPYHPDGRAFDRPTWRGLLGLAVSRTARVHIRIRLCKANLPDERLNCTGRTR